MWRSALAANPFFAVKPQDYEHSAPYALWADWMALWAASLSPSGLIWSRWGLCAPTPFIEHIIDFDKIRHITPHFYLNAYNVTKQVIDDFTKDEITPDHFRAALAFPFIYGPYRLNGNLYYEGTVVDCLNFKELVEPTPTTPRRSSRRRPLEIHGKLRVAFEERVHPRLDPFRPEEEESVANESLLPAPGTPERRYAQGPAAQR